jgi:hypothetical protein
MVGLFVAAAMSGALTSPAHAQGFRTQEYPMLKGVTKNIKNGWSTTPLLTIGETGANGEDVNLDAFGYRPVGIPDGIGAFQSNRNVVLFVSHELSDNAGNTYTLANGTPVIGARISKIKVNKNNRTVTSAGLAYDLIYDRYGNVVTSASQISEGLSGNNGFSRFCSGYLVEKYYNGFESTIYFTGEETSDGQLAALNVGKQELHVVPMAGRAAWENVTSLENYGSNKVVMLFGDDRSSAPVILYIGEKGTTADGYNPSNAGFLKKNGLANGHIYVWVNDVSGETTPAGFYGTGASRTGKFVRVEHYDPSKAGMSGYDAAGFASQATVDANYDLVGHFEFSRPEDLSANPADKTQVVVASTGNDDLFGGVEKWGVTYLFDLDDASLQSQLALPLDDINNIPATVTILYDGNDAGGGQFAHPDYGLRSPDNLDWADNGYIYIQEDRSYDDFGLTSGIEASVWQMDPADGTLQRILEIDRNAVPYTQIDGSPTDIGNWESSGVLDVTSLFNAAPGETILVIDVEAHSVTGGPIGGSADLVQGGQILLVSKIFPGLGEKDSQQAAQGERKNIANVSITPNPADTHVQLDRVSEVKVFDLNGKLLMHVFNAKSVDVSELKAGTYLIEIDGQSQKLVVQ